MTKTRQDNDVIDWNGAIYAEIETKLSWPIELGVVCYDNKTRQQHDRSYKCAQHQKWNWVVMTDWI